MDDWRCFLQRKDVPITDYIRFSNPLQALNSGFFSENSVWYTHSPPHAVSRPEFFFTLPFLPALKIPGQPLIMNYEL